MNAEVQRSQSFIAERISARHLILEYGLFERIYVCMYVSHAYIGMQ